jgi:hypothetical protein
MHLLPFFTLRLLFLPNGSGWLKPLIGARGFRIKELEEQQQRGTVDKTSLEELIEEGVQFDKTLAASMIAGQVVAIISDYKLALQNVY